jgi:hypothetical protein
VPVLDVRPLTPERFGDLAGLFEEGGDPKWCWCTFFRARGRDWSNSTGDQNRADLRSLTDRKGTVVPGLVGYEDSQAWISLGPREDYERLA